MNMMNWVMSKSGINKLCDQIRAEQKSNFYGKTKEDYLIRGENNQRLRWSLTCILIIAHMIRIMFFENAYFLLTSIFFIAYIEKLPYYLFPPVISILKASDGASEIHHKPDGRVSHYEPLICIYLRHDLSTLDFHSLVLRILEFKLWYLTTKFVLYAFLLTWYTLLKCSFLGPEVLILSMFFSCCWLVSMMPRKSEEITFTDE